MEMPIVRGNSAFLPIGPARILVNGGPELFGSKGDALGEADLRAAEINADQHAPNIEDDRTQFGGHRLLALRFGDDRGALAGSGAAWPPPRTQNTDNRRQNRKKNNCGDDLMNIFPDVGDP